MSVLIRSERLERFFAKIRRSPLLRLVLFLLIVVLVILPFKILLGFIPGKNVLPPTVLLLLVTFAVVLIFLYRWLVQIFEDRDAKELSIQTFPSTLLSGAAYGSSLFLSVIGILTVSGIAHFHGFNGPAGLLKSSIINGHGAIFEEIVFRGIIYRSLEERFGSAISLVLSAALFGLVHLGNPSANLVSTVVIALTAGLLLPLAYSASRTLWMPIGLHFAWNFTESGLFGLDVSGFDLHGLIKVDLVGPNILTGGSFGPEASIVTVGVCLVASAAFGYIMCRRGNWVPLSIKSCRRTG
jgi:membrane protease YdiL (CAAX protease family)